MLCPHCGKEIVTPDYAEPVNTAGQPAITVPFDTTCAAPSLFATVGHGTSLWLNTCAGAGAESVTLYYTVDGNDKR